MPLVPRLHIAAAALTLAAARVLAAAPDTAEGAPGSGNSVPRCETRLRLDGIGSASEDRARVAELTGAAPVRPQLFRRWSTDTETVLCDSTAPHPSAVDLAKEDGVTALPLTSRTYLNTGYADDRNDGAVFQGRGVSTDLTGGVRLRWKFFSAAVAPEAAWQQNRDFFHLAMNQAGYSPYANPYNNGSIDLPLRFGPTSFWTVTPGQSYARVDAFGVAAGFSTENLWWGPGMRNSLLMTNSGPGMPHLFLGTSRPVDIWIGWLEAQVIWGRPQESKWFTSTTADDRRLFTAFTMGYEPAFAPGLFLGVARVFLYRIPPSGLPLRDYFGALFQPFLKESVAATAGGGSADNQLVSLMARWALPGGGIEIYGEWGRDDASWDLQDLVTEPEHSQAFMIGLQKVFRAGKRTVRFTAELTHTLEKPIANPTHAVGIFYTHSDEKQGYTNDGQMIGAGIGPQADSEFVALDLFHERGRAGVWGERVLRNDRWYLLNVKKTAFLADAEIVGGVRGTWAWRDLEVELSLGAARRFNMDFGPNVTSLKGMLGLTWIPGEGPRNDAVTRTPRPPIP